METIEIVAIAASIISLLFAAFLTSTVIKKDGGDEKEC